MDKNLKKTCHIARPLTINVNGFFFPDNAMVNMDRTTGAPETTPNLANFNKLCNKIMP